MARMNLRAIARRALNDAIVEASKELTNQIQEAYIDVISEFYAHYKPRVYERTGATYMASSYGQEGEGVLMSHDEPGVGGIEVDPYYIWHGYPTAKQTNAYHQSTSYVFWRTYEQGIHGMTPSEARQFHNKLKRDVWSKERPSFLKRGWIRDLEYIEMKPPKAPMRPSPKARMKKRFRNIKKSDNIDPIVDAAITKYLNKYLPK